MGMSDEEHEIECRERLDRPLTLPCSSPADPVNHPAHYTQVAGVECIEVIEARKMTFCHGNAFKYLWRAGDKGPLLEDLKKARWHLDREIARLEGGK
jgi:hypothetical protein